MNVPSVTTNSCRDTVIQPSPPYCDGSQTKRQYLQSSLRKGVQECMFPTWEVTLALVFRLHVDTEVFLAGVHFVAWLAQVTAAVSIIDPWIYIVLRKENFEFVEKMYKKCKGTATLSEPQSSTSIHNLGKLPSTGSSNDCTVFNIQI